MREASGIDNYNMKLMLLNEKNSKVDVTWLGIVSDDGERLYFLDDYGTGVDISSKITEEEAAEIGWCLVKSQPQRTFAKSAKLVYYESPPVAKELISRAASHHLILTAALI